MHSEKWANASIVSSNVFFNVALRTTSIGEKNNRKDQMEDFHGLDLEVAYIISVPNPLARIHSRVL